MKISATTRLDELHQELRNVRTQRRRKEILKEITKLKGGKTVEDVRREAWGRPSYKLRGW